MPVAVTWKMLSSNVIGLRHCKQERWNTFPATLIPGNARGLIRWLERPAQRSLRESQNGVRFPWKLRRIPYSLAARSTCRRTLTSTEEPKLLRYYPGQKKEPSSRFAARRTLFHVRVISCSIRRDQRRAKSRTLDRGSDLPCADRGVCETERFELQKCCRRLRLVLQQKELIGLWARAFVCSHRETVSLSATLWHATTVEQKYFCCDELLSDLYL